MHHPLPQQKKTSLRVAPACLQFSLVKSYFEPTHQQREALELLALVFLFGTKAVVRSSGKICEPEPAFPGHAVPGLS